MVVTASPSVTVTEPSVFSVITAPSEVILPLASTVPPSGRVVVEPSAFSITVPSGRTTVPSVVPGFTSSTLSAGRITSPVPGRTVPFTVLPAGTSTVPSGFTVTSSPAGGVMVVSSSPLVIVTVPSAVMVPSAATLPPSGRVVMVPSALSITVPSGSTIVPSGFTTTFSPSAGVMVVTLPSLSVTVTALPMGALTVPSGIKVKFSPAGAVIVAPSGVSTTEPVGRVIVPSLPITIDSIFPVGTIMVLFSCLTLAS